MVVELYNFIKMPIGKTENSSPCKQSILQVNKNLLYRYCLVNCIIVDSSTDLDTTDDSAQPFSTVVPALIGLP